MKDIQNFVPRISSSEAKVFVSETYGLDVDLTPLESERDQNFLCASSGGEKYVLKIANLKDNPGLLIMQNEMMNFLTNKLGVRICPSVIKSIDGAEITTGKFRGRDYNFRLLTYLEGKLFSGLKDPGLEDFKTIGELYGEIDTALFEFDHSSAARYLHWDLKNFIELNSYVEEVPEKSNRLLVEHFYQQYEAFFFPLAPHLRQGVIHNDGNDNNIIFTERDGRRFASGIIDFGDVVRTYIISEIAIVIAYALFKAENIQETFSSILRGYHRYFTITVEEARAVFHLVYARLCSSVLISAHQKKLNPNNEYLTVSEAPAWRTLQKLSGFSPPLFEKFILDSLGLEVRKTHLDREDILRTRRAHFGKSLSLSYADPLRIEKGFLQYLYDDSGRKYLDCVNNVCHVGHAHPAVTRAIQKQSIVLNTNTRYLYESLAEYSEKLTAKFPDPLNVCFLVCSGSEANELAIRLARNFTERKNILVSEHA